jgi:hypothetical protein
MAALCPGSLQLSAYALADDDGDINDTNGDGPPSMPPFSSSSAAAVDVPFGVTSTSTGRETTVDMLLSVSAPKPGRTARDFPLAAGRSASGHDDGGEPMSRNPQP